MPNATFGVGETLVKAHLIATRGVSGSAAPYTISELFGKRFGELRS